MTPSSPAGLICTACSTEKTVKNFFLHNPTHLAFFMLYPFKRQCHKMVKHTQTIRRQTIRRQFADKLFECV